MSQLIVSILLYNSYNSVFFFMYFTRNCPSSYMCLAIGDNPDNGWTNFDNFFYSMLSTFQLITLDFWENLYDLVRLMIMGSEYF